MLDLVRKALQQPPLELRPVADGLVERDAGHAHGVDHHRLLTEPGHELRAQPNGQEGRQGHDQARERQHELAPREGAGERPAIAASQPAHQSIVVAPAALLQRVAGEHGHQRDRQEHRAGQREDHRQRHRLEQLALYALEREDRQIDNRDDQLAEQRRLADLDRGVADDLAHAPARAVFFESSGCVLDQDDRAVDDQAEVDRAEAHQAAGDPELQHRVEREQHRQRDRQRDDQPRAKVAEEHEQHRDDEQRALEEVVANRVQHRTDQVDPAVDRRHLDVLGQAVANLIEPRLEFLGDLAAVLAHQHEAEPEHGLAPPLGRHRPATDLMALADLRDVAHPDQRAVDLGEHHRLDLRDAADESLPLDQLRLPSLLEHAAAGVAIAALQDAGDVVEGQAVLDQPTGIDGDVKLPLVAAPGVDLRDARHLDHLRADHPLVQRP